MVGAILHEQLRCSWTSQAQHTVETAGGGAAREPNPDPHEESGTCPQNKGTSPGAQSGDPPSKKE